MRLLRIVIALSVASAARARPVDTPSLDAVPAEVQKSFIEFLPDRDLSAFSQTARGPRSASSDAISLRCARNKYIQLFGTATFSRKFLRSDETPLQETLAAIDEDMRRVFEFGQRGVTSLLPSPAAIDPTAYDFAFNRVFRLHEAYANSIFDHELESMLYLGMPGNINARRAIDALRAFEDRWLESQSGFISFDELGTRLIDSLMLLEATGSTGAQINTAEAVPLHIRAYMVSRYFAFWALLFSDDQEPVHNLALIATARYIIGGTDLVEFRRAFMHVAATEHLSTLQSYTAEGREMLQHNQVAEAIPEPVMTMIIEFFDVL